MPRLQEYQEYNKKNNKKAAKAARESRATLGTPLLQDAPTVVRGAGSQPGVPRTTASTPPRLLRMRSSNPPLSPTTAYAAEHLHAPSSNQKGKSLLFLTTRPTDMSCPYDTMVENNVQFGSPDKRAGNRVLNIFMSVFYAVLLIGALGRLPIPGMRLPGNMRTTGRQRNGGPS